MKVAGTIMTLCVVLFVIFEDLSDIIAKFIALVGALSASIYLCNLQRIIYNFPWMLAVFSLSLFSSVCFGIFTYIFENSTLDTNTFNGIFGVFSLKWIFIHILISLLTGIINIKLFSSLI